MSLQGSAIFAFCTVLWAVPFAGGCSSILGFEEARPFRDEVGQDASVDGNPGAVGGGPDSRADGGDAGTGLCGNTSSDVKNCGLCGHDCTAVANVGSPASISCSAAKCVLLPAACADGYGDCDGNPENGCETSLRSADHCGACTKMCPSDAPLCATNLCLAACPPSMTQCGTSCVDLDNDPKHCGDCASECSRPASGGSPTCTQKKCGIQCLPSFHSCPGTSDCASDTDATRCGPMCIACQAPVNGDAACSNATCAISCRAPAKLCASACLDTSKDVKNCGACGHDCTALPHLGSTSGVSCSAGVCVVPPTACSAGFGHCTTNPDDGCETDITTPAHCQSCTTQCPADMAVCTAAGCKSQCPPATPTLCSGSCVDLNADAMHCGACTTACTQPTSGGSTTCEQKACVLHCLSGFHACGASQCASDTDAARCEGPSCHACVAPANGSAQCAANQCVPSCNAGFHLCNGACVSDSDPANCGTSCTPCAGPTVGSGSASCTAGKCGLNCPQGHACTGGCYSNTDPNHCGDPACAICPGPTMAGGPGSAQCALGSCSIACNNGSNCGGACYDLNTNAAHCGSCTNSCATGQVCLSGACAIDCGTKMRCGMACIDTMTDPNNCGTCGHVCPTAGPSGTATCAGGVCKNVCNGNAPLCNNLCPNYQTDSQNCGSCGMACTGGRVCTNARCCMPAQINAGGICCAQGQVNAGGICCAQGQINANGICCNQGEFNSNGICCPTGQFNSNGVCCPTNRVNCGGGVCRDLTTDVNNCNACGHVCPSMPNTNVACSASACVYQCKNQTNPLSCHSSSQPACGTWDFESIATTEGWVHQPIGSDCYVAGSLQNTTAPSGSHALVVRCAFNFNSSGVTNGLLWVTAPLCPSNQALNIGGRHIQFQVTAIADPGSPPVSSVSDEVFSLVRGSDGLGTSFGVIPFAPSTTVDQAIPNDGRIFTDMGIGFQIRKDGPTSGAWAGTIYIDDIRLP